MQACPPLKDTLFSQISTMKPSSSTITDNKPKCLIYADRCSLSNLNEFKQTGKEEQVCRCAKASRNIPVIVKYYDLNSHESVVSCFFLTICISNDFIKISTLLLRANVNLTVFLVGGSESFFLAASAAALCN